MMLRCGISNGLKMLLSVLGALWMLPAMAQSGPLPAAMALSYKVGPGDIIKISVLGSTAYDATVEVRTDGTIPVNEVGAVDVQGLSTTDIAFRLASEFRRNGILINPIVNILVQEYRSHTVVVLGSVAKPGEYPLDRSNLRLTDILARAGAQLGVGGGTIRIRDAGGAQHDIVAMQVINGLVDPAIQPGDTVVVSDAATFYISGEVQKAGSYSIEPGLTYGQAVALAGGVTSRGARKSLKVTRTLADGTKKIVRVKEQDVVLPRDLISVGARIF